MSAPVQPPLEQSSALAQEDRKRHLNAIVLKGLPPFPQTALELSKVLGGASPDMKKAGKLIRTDPTLSSQVLRMCNSPMFGLRTRVISIEQAAVLLGTDRLRNLALTTSMVDFAGKALPQSQMDSFWQHSFMAALLSEFLAKRREYFEKDQAYIAGLLHDIGQIPQWILLAEEKEKSEAPPAGWMDNPRIEQEYFGMDHCELGNTMAGFWDFLPPFLDALDNHRTPELAQHDSILVRMVGTIEYFLLGKEQMIPVPPEDLPPSAAGVQLFEKTEAYEPLHQQVANLGVGLFDEIEWPYVEEALEEEYGRIHPLVKDGLKGVLAGVGA